MDENLLAEARQAQERLKHLDHAADAARTELRRAVHRLVSDGARPRDVAAALGLSGQQLHQIVQQGAGSEREGGGRPAYPGLACTFCGTSQHEVRKLIAGPGVYICDACVELAEGVLSSGGVTSTRLGQVYAVAGQDRSVRCRFCDKHRDQVAGMAAMSAETGDEASGPAAICGECLPLCIEIIAEELALLLGRGALPGRIPGANDVLRDFAPRRSGVTRLIAELRCLSFSCGRMAAALHHQDYRGCQQDRGNNSHERDRVKQGCPLMRPG